MKEYTRDALGALGNFYERVALVYDPDFSTKDINEVMILSGILFWLF